MRKMGLALILPLIALNGCVIAVNTPDSENHWYDRQHRNERIIDHMPLGRNRALVEDELGKPDFVDSFLRDGSTFTVLYYRTRQIHSDGKTSRDETTPLVFVDDKLVGRGTSAIDHATAK